MRSTLPRTFAATVMPSMVNTMPVGGSPTHAVPLPPPPFFHHHHHHGGSPTAAIGGVYSSAPLHQAPPTQQQQVAMPNSAAAATAPRVMSAKRNVSSLPGDWSCGSCGAMNFARRTECFKCNRSKGSAAASPAGSASSHAAPSKSADASKSSNAAATAGGSWMCVCHTSNLITRDTCFMCQLPREATPGYSGVASGAASSGAHHEADMIRITDVDVGGAAPTPQTMSASTAVSKAAKGAAKKKGDWTCGTCKGHNFASREACYSCSAPKSAAEHVYTETTASSSSHAPLTQHEGGATGSATRNATLSTGSGSNRKFAQMAGDWNCAGCGVHNFRNRETCRGCNNPKDETARILSADDAMMPGDWKCPACNEVNFRKRDVCRACAVPKPVAAAASASASAAAAETDIGASQSASA